MTTTIDLSTVTEAVTLAASTVTETVTIDLSTTLQTVTLTVSENNPSGGGSVTSVNGQTGVVVLDADSIDDTATTNKFTTAADIAKLAGIEPSAQVNVNADWDAVSGDAVILNKPTLGTAALANTGDFATSAQGGKADTALQPSSIGVTVQGYSSVLENTTASFTTTDENKLDLAVVSDTTGITGADAISNIVSLTQAEYDAIAVPNATTLYVITD